MKLTHVILYYPSMEKGGIEVNLRHLVKYFTNKGIKISLISINFKKICKFCFKFIKNNNYYHWKKLIEHTLSVRNFEKITKRFINFFVKNNNARS